MAMASLEFDDYALIWWEQLLSDREDAGQGDVRSWAKMKREMKDRFVPKHHCHDLFDKLQNLRQVNLSAEVYYRVMENAMIRANIYEDEEQSIARFMSGLHCNIKRIVEFQQYRNLIELVHQTSKAERQLQQDTEISRAGPSSAKGTTSASKFIPRSSVGRGTVNNSSGGSYSNEGSTSKNKGFTTIGDRNKPANSSSTFMGSITKSSGIQCFKYDKHGNVIGECPNNHTVIVNDKGEYESTNEEDQEPNDEGKF
jgi:hypothetical protein